jgi:hypothetical protein
MVLLNEKERKILLRALTYLYKSMYSREELEEADAGEDVFKKREELQKKIRKIISKIRAS